MRRDQQAVDADREPARHDHRRLRGKPDHRARPARRLLRGHGRERLRPERLAESGDRDAYANAKTFNDELFLEAAAAKIRCSEAAEKGGGIAHQVHGAIGYTAEYDLSLWLLKVRALVGAWGSPADHRALVLSSLVEPVENREA